MKDQGFVDFALQNEFLVSMPQLTDPNFNQTVILLCKHDSSGTMGIVINRLTDYKLEDVFSQLDINTYSAVFAKHPIINGGPVYPELGLIIHTHSNRNWESSLPIGEDLWLTTSKDIIEDMAKGKGPEKMMMSLGYAGWGPGQLESEIKANSWFTTPVDQQILFSADVSEKWHASARLLGIDTNHISQHVGHA